jgi:predicted nucleic acid-binding protein
MKIYLDNCAIQRPLDDKSQLRIVLEAEVILGIFSLCEKNIIEIFSSDVLFFEISNTPNITRKEYALEFLKLSSNHIDLNSQIEIRANELNKIGIKALDALHLASAEIANADLFCTCDDKFLKRIKKIKNIKIKVVTPLELIEEIEK